MSRPLPRALRLSRSVVDRKDGLARHIRRTLNPPSDQLPRVVHAYALTEDERSFARHLLAFRTQVWLWRSHQQAFCGDFVLVDLSNPDPASRPAWVVDLKRGAPLRRSGWQLRLADEALAELAAEGVIAPEVGPRVLTGDRQALLDHLAARPLLR